ncbi:MAG: hypothetical protein K6G28_03505 [Acholeplasmatales bacterium]|nr:hypothetical protein [Acholeplasmatales bacterium]
MKNLKNIYDEIDKKQDIKLNKLSMPTEYNLNTISISYYIPDYEDIIWEILSLSYNYTYENYNLEIVSAPLNLMPDVENYSLYKKGLVFPK